MRLVNKWYFSPDHIRIDLLINEFVIKLYGCSVIPGVSVDNSFRTRPVNCTQAHGTRLTTGINFTAIQLKRIQFFARLSYSNYLGMCRGVIARSNHINTFRDYRFIHHYDAAERSSIALLHALPRKLNGSLKKPFFIVIYHMASLSPWFNHSLSTKITAILI